MSDIVVGKYRVCDIPVKGDPGRRNPFMSGIAATMEHESGALIENIPGFYDGDGTWKIRFSPNREGLWKGRVGSEDAELNKAELGPIRCEASGESRAHGTLGIDPAHPERFAWEDGTPFVPLGFECDWLFAYHQADPARCRRHLDLVAERGFNYVVTNVYAHTGFSTAASRFEGGDAPEYVFGPPRMYAFGGTNDAPDHGRLNTAFFQDFDRLMEYLHRKGIVVHLMIQVQNKKVSWPARRSVEDDLFWRYVVARYQAYGNLVWDISKESFNLHRETGSHAYCLSRIAYVRLHDAYRHLVTVHDPDAGSAGTCHSAVDRAVDLVSDQIHLADVDMYNREAIRRLRGLGKPYLNIEYGYELGAEDLRTYKSRTTAPWQDVLRWTWALYAGGAYAGYYYSNTSWDLVKFEPEPAGWARYRHLRDVLDSVRFNEMAADNELVDRGYCLAAPGRQYLVYLPEGGDVRIDLSALSTASGRRVDAFDGTVSAEWLDIYTGARRARPVAPSGFATALANPLDDPRGPCAVVVTVG